MLQAELLELRGDERSAASGTVLEARKDKRLGTVVTALVRDGTLRVGDSVLCGQACGKVKRLLLDRGNTVQQAGPSSPVQVCASETIV
jgi:translation initiation factor IF-2